MRPLAVLGLFVALAVTAVAWPRLPRGNPSKLPQNVQRNAQLEDEFQSCDDMASAIGTCFNGWDGSNGPPPLSCCPLMNIFIGEDGCGRESILTAWQYTMARIGHRPFLGPSYSAPMVAIMDYCQRKWRNVACAFCELGMFLAVGFTKVS
jgi:hypothetical protein